MIAKRRASRRYTPARHALRVGTAAATAALLVLASGCGTQVDDARIEAVGNGYRAPVIAGAPGTEPAGSGAVVGSGPAAGAPTEAGAVTAQGTTALGATAAPAVTAASAKSQGGSVPKAGAAITGAATCTARLSPIVLGQTLATSGLVGASIGNMRQGLALWAKDVNARGGVQCHPVQVIALDDGSDSARVASNWNTLIHQRGAVAMVGAGEPITIGALRASAERDKVPVIGGDGVAVDWFQSPYLFPQGAHPFSTYEGATIEAARAVSGAKTAGLMYCVEASICTDIKAHFPEMARLAGLTVGAVKAVSLTQSDYTAECQLFKNAEVDVLWLVQDGSANTRLARSCAALNYFPTIATSAIGMPPAAAADPALQRNTVYLGSATVPYMTTDTPGAAAFAQALQTYLPGFSPDQNTMVGWSAGKLFEAALAQVADRARGGDVTTEMILDGLWKLKNEKLAGISPGVTFTEGGPAKAPRCYYMLLVSTQGTTAPLGSRLGCVKG